MYPLKLVHKHAVLVTAFSERPKTLDANKAEALEK